jgi:hypothetical protein
MANILEIGDPDQIDLNDPLLRSAITDKGDMNFTTLRKLLKQISVGNTQKMPSPKFRI